jgi:hypothetical protein
MLMSSSSWRCSSPVPAAQPRRMPYRHRASPPSTRSKRRQDSIFCRTAESTRDAPRRSSRALRRSRCGRRNASRPASGEGRAPGRLQNPNRSFFGGKAKAGPVTAGKVVEAGKPPSRGTIPHRRGRAMPSLPPRQPACSRRPSPRDGDAAGPGVRGRTQVSREIWVRRGRHSTLSPAGLGRDATRKARITRIGAGRGSATSPLANHGRPSPSESAGRDRQLPTERARGADVGLPLRGARGGACLGQRVSL